MNKESLLISETSNYIKDEQALLLIRDALELIKTKFQDRFILDKISLNDFVLDVCLSLAKMQSEPNTLISALLYNLNENENKLIEDKFSKEVLTMVSALRKIDNVKKLTNYEIDNENFRKIFVALAKDYKVIIIRLVIQETLMGYLNLFNQEFRENVSKETLDIYAPLAHRLGMFKLKSKLENKSLFYLDNDMYLYIQKSLKQKEEERIETIEEMKRQLTKLLNDNEIEFYSISGRPKQIYSIYNKMKNKKLTFDEVYDLLALRIITKTEVNCYEVLGYIHTVYKPVPGKFKDYIAVPKPNMYQSLHTSVIGSDDNIYEIQIRTREMDDIAEKGIAAHWKYKEGTSLKAQKQIDEQLHWFRDYISSDVLNKESNEQVENLKKDIFEADIYVMSPRGKVIDLPVGSTPIDFAYRIHSNVGHSCVGALVNGIMVPLNKELKTGDVVVIKTSKLHTLPSNNWLQFVKTSLAKNQIKKALLQKDKEEFRQQIIDRGKELVSEEVRNKNIDVKDVLGVLADVNFLKNYGVSKLEDLYMSVANRTVSATSLIEKVRTRLGQTKTPTFEFKKKEISRPSKEGIIVKGIDNIKVTLANCCNPIPGDEIIGYVSRGKGVRIHQSSCATIEGENSRLIEVSWDENIVNNILHQVDIIIRASDRSNLLIEIMNVFSQLKITVVELNALIHNDTLTSSFQISIMVKNTEHFTSVLKAIKNVQGVYEVLRVSRN